MSYRIETRGREKQSINPSCPPGDVGIGIISSLDSNQAKNDQRRLQLSCLINRTVQ